MTTQEAIDKIVAITGARCVGPNEDGGLVTVLRAGPRNTNGPDDKYVGVFSEATISSWDKKAHGVWHVAAIYDPAKERWVR